jgi:hypothetical protein
VGETSVDEGCEDCADWKYYLCVLLKLIWGFADGNAVVLVYGVLFLDWNQENQPFQGVGQPLQDELMELIQCRYEPGSLN